MQSTSTSSDQLPLRFKDEFGLAEATAPETTAPETTAVEATANGHGPDSEAGERHAEDDNVEADNAESPDGEDPNGEDPDGSDEGSMREVLRRRQRRAMGRENYARLGAASLAARLQLVMPPADRVHPGQEVGMRVIEKREVRRHGLGTATLRTYGTFTSATPAAVRWADSLDTWADTRPVRERALLWALTEWHQEKWVAARRLFAAAGEPKWSRHALRKWDASSLRAFPHEIEFPSRAYDTFGDYETAMGRFYFSGAWNEACSDLPQPLWQ
jgi:hypothetical protein